MKKAIIMIIMLTTAAFSGCKNEEKSIMENSNIETLESMEFSEQNIDQGNDEDSTQQIASAESDAGLVMDKVNISLGDITRQTLVLYVENLSQEGIVIDKIYLKEYLNEQWFEMKPNEIQTKLPAYGLAPNSTGEIAYYFDEVYGELSKGEYICAIEINGELKEINFEIK